MIGPGTGPVTVMVTGESRRAGRPPTVTGGPVRSDRKDVTLFFPSLSVLRTRMLSESLGSTDPEALTGRTERFFPCVCDGHRGRGSGHVRRRCRGRVGGRACQCQVSERDSGTVP
jgi:hypothetical protein